MHKTANSTAQLGAFQQPPLFLYVDRPDIALHWLQLAVDQERPDAMHNLAKLHRTYRLHIIGTVTMN